MKTDTPQTVYLKELTGLLTQDVAPTGYAATSGH